MADFRITQPTFTGGEVSPELYGRKDLARYQIGLRKALNVFIHATGGASNRSGLRFVGEVKESDKEARLTTFEAAGDDAYLLVWGDQNVRPVWHGAYIDDGGSPYEVSTPYAHDELDRIYQEQSNDIATIAHPLYPPHELRRYSPTDWQIEAVSFSPPGSPPSAVSANAVYNYTNHGKDKLPQPHTYAVAAVFANGEESMPSEDAVSGNTVLGYEKNYVDISWDAPSARRPSSGVPSYRLAGGDLIPFFSHGTHVITEYSLLNDGILKSIGVHSNAARSYSVKIAKDNGGGSFDIIQSHTFNHPGGGWSDFTLPVEYTIPSSGTFRIGVYTANYSRVDGVQTSNRFIKNPSYQIGGNIGVGSHSLSAVTTPYVSTRALIDLEGQEDENLPVEYIVYKKVNGIYGSIGRTPDSEFRDNNILPDYTNGPQDGYNPFVNEGNYPSVVSFSQQRRVFAASLNRPQTIWMTQSGNYANMGRSQPLRESDSIEFTMAAERKQDIYHIVSLESGVIVFTRSGEWKVTGRDGDVLTPTSILPEPQSRYGSSRHLRPYVIGETLVFADRTASVVRGMEYSFEIDRYKSDDLTLLARHLFRDRKIVSWSYAGSPHGIIWCVMDDGKALSLTYMKEHDVWGWGRHETRGRFLDVSSVPENGYDVPYFLVERRVMGVNRKYVEYLERREITDIRNAFFVDCGLSYDMPVVVDEIDTGASTRIRVDGNSLVDGDEIEIDESAFYNDQDERVGTLDGRYLVTNDGADWLVLSHAELDLGIEIGDPVDTSDLVGTYPENGVMRKCISQISGLDHLEGREVVALADGIVIDAETYGGPMIVTDGEIPEFQQKHARVHVGIPYQSVIGTLDLLNTQQDDNGVLKAAGPVYVRLQDTRGVKVGMAEEEAVELHSRLDEGYYEPPDLKNGMFQIEDASGWDNDIPIWFVQDYPLPMTILGVTITYAYGGDGS